MQQVVLNNSYQVTEKPAMAFIFQESLRREQVKIWGWVQADFYMGFGSGLHAKRLPLPVRPRSHLLSRGITWAVAWLSPFTKPCFLLCLHPWTEKSSSDLGGDGISGLRHLHYISKENRHHRNFVNFLRAP